MFSRRRELLWVDPVPSDLLRHCLRHSNDYGAGCWPPAQHIPSSAPVTNAGIRIYIQLNARIVTIRLRLISYLGYKYVTMDVFLVSHNKCTQIRTCLRIYLRIRTCTCDLFAHLYSTFDT